VPPAPKPILTFSSQGHAVGIAQALLALKKWPKTAKEQTPYIVEMLRLGGHFSRAGSNTWTRHDLSRRYIIKVREVRTERPIDNRWVSLNYSGQNETIGRFFERVVDELAAALAGTPEGAQLQQRSSKVFAGAKKKRLSATVARELFNLTEAVRARVTENRASQLDFDRLRNFAQVSEAGRIMLEGVIWSYDVPAKAFFWNGQEFVTPANTTFVPPPRLGVRPMNPLEVGPEVRRALIDLTGAYKFVGIVPQLDVSAGLDFAPSLMYRLTVDVIRDARERLKRAGWTDWQVDVIDEQFRLPSVASLAGGLQERFPGLQDLDAIGIKLLDVWVACGGHISSGFSGTRPTLGTGLPPPTDRTLNVNGHIYPMHPTRSAVDDLKRFILLRGP
jgi:hypothetical protein